MEFKILFVLFFLFVLIPSASASVVVNEILYNPSSEQGGDACGEWIELYNNFSYEINLSGWKLRDSGSSNTSLSGIIKPYDYLIVADNITNFNNLWNCSCDVIEGNFRFNNLGDEIWLWNQTSLVNYINYVDIAEEGESIQLINSSWTNCAPTPGALNNCTQEQNQSKRIDIRNLPQTVLNNGTTFSIEIKFSNFDNRTYKLKVGITDLDGYTIGEIWNSIEEEWQSANNYIQNAFTINNSNLTYHVLLKINSDKNYIGNASLQVKLQYSDSSTIIAKSDFLYVDVLNAQDQSDQEESEIKIIDAPSKAQFGETVEVELDIYKGDTSKYAVYVYVEDQDGNKVSDKITLHFKTKFTEQTVEVELLLKCRNETGSYDIVVEGLGTEDREEIELDACGNNGNESNDAGDTITIGDFTYSLTIPNSINIDKEFTVKLKIANKAETNQNFLVWSYVYRGSKCYSCSDNITRESNAQELTIEAGSSTHVTLMNIVDEAEAEPGLYKLKIKVLQEGLKTPKEFTYDITIKEKQELTSSNQQNQQTDQSNVQENQKSDYINGFAVIESESFSINKALPYILATLCMLLVIYIIIKKI